MNYYKILSILAIFGSMGVNTHAMEGEKPEGKRKRETTPENKRMDIEKEPKTPENKRMDIEKEPKTPENKGTIPTNQNPKPIFRRNNAPVGNGAILRFMEVFNNINNSDDDAGKL